MIQNRRNLRLFGRICLRLAQGGSCTNLSAIVERAHYNHWYPSLLAIERAGLVTVQHHGPGRKLIITPLIIQLTLFTEAQWIKKLS